MHELLAPAGGTAGGEKSKNVVSCVAYHPKRAQMISCSTLGVIQVWDSE